MNNNRSLLWQILDPVFGLFSTFILMLGSLLFFDFLRSALLDRAVYSYSYDKNFYVYAFLTALGHLLTFVLCALFLYRFYKNLNYYARLVILLLILLAQMYFRVFAVSLGHLDCDTRCGSDVLPQVMDSKVSVIVGATLGLAFIAAAAWRYLPLTSKRL